VETVRTYWKEGNLENIQIIDTRLEMVMLEVETYGRRSHVIAQATAKNPRRMARICQRESRREVQILQARPIQEGKPLYRYYVPPTIILSGRRPSSRPCDADTKLGVAARTRGTRGSFLIKSLRHKRPVTRAFFSAPNRGNCSNLVEGMGDVLLGESTLIRSLIPFRCSGLKSWHLVILNSASTV